MATLQLSSLSWCLPIANTRVCFPALPPRLIQQRAAGSRCRLHLQRRSSACLVRQGAMHIVCKAAKSQATCQLTWRQQAAAAIERARIQDVNQAFAVAGTLPDLPLTLATALPVSGFTEVLQLPLYAQQVDGLVKLGEPASFGRDTDTVLDPAVRKALQIDAACVNANELWQQQLQQLTSKVAAALGLSATVTVEARPYKLLLYTEGGHFKAHKDTGKEAGMFGTLVVQLPVIGGHKGGELVFSHHGKTYRWETQTDSGTTLQYAAFYADVDHELRPITSGTRVVMVYNLVRVGNGEVPAALDGGPVVRQLRGAVDSWHQELAAANISTPAIICVPLKHQYTKASLEDSGSLAMKGADAKMLGCLSHPDAALDVHLALLSRTETSCDDYYHVEFNVDICLSTAGTHMPDEVMEQLRLADSWTARGKVTPQLQLLSGAPVPVWSTKRSLYDEDEDYEDEGEDEAGEGEDDEAGEGQGEGGADEAGEGEVDAENAAYRAAVHREPDEEVRKGYTGNEGPSVDRIYRDAVVIVWPKAHANVLLGQHLDSAVYALQLRCAQGNADDIVTAVEHITYLFQRPRDAADSGSLISKHLGDGYRLADALESVAQLDTHIAVPALASIIPHLPVINDVGYKSVGGTLCATILDCIAKHGTTAELVAAAATLVSSHAVACTTACVQLAFMARQQSTQLTNAVAEAILSQTLLSSECQQVVASMQVHDVCSLAVMLCVLPACHQHLDALVTVVLALPDPQPVLQQLVANADIRNAASHLPAPLKLLAQARQKHVQQFLQPDHHSHGR